MDMDIDEVDLSNVEEVSMKLRWSGFKKKVKKTLKLIRRKVSKTYRRLASDNKSDPPVPNQEEKGEKRFLKIKVLGNGKTGQKQVLECLMRKRDLYILAFTMNGRWFVTSDSNLRLTSVDFHKLPWSCSYADRKIAKEHIKLGYYPLRQCLEAAQGHCGLVLSQRVFLTLCLFFAEGARSVLVAKEIYGNLRKEARNVFTSLELSACSIFWVENWSKISLLYFVCKDQAWDFRKQFKDMTDARAATVCVSSKESVRRNMALACYVRPQET